jgi:hypothetical protein
MTASKVHSSLETNFKGIKVGKILDKEFKRRLGA